jgi:hypothetical protein
MRTQFPQVFETSFVRSALKRAFPSSPLRARRAIKTASFRKHARMDALQAAVLVLMFSFASCTRKTLISVTVTPSTTSLAVGGMRQYTAVGLYTDGTQQNITANVQWTSTTISPSTSPPTTVATVSIAGIAKGLSVGSTTAKRRLI